MRSNKPGDGVGIEDHHAISQFLFHEALLLDGRRYEEWLELLADDLSYRVPVRLARMPREESREFEGPDGSGHFDDSRAQIAQRVRKLGTRRAWSDVPSSRTRHLITNVSATHTENDDEFEVTSAFLLYRTRANTYQGDFAGARFDLVRRAPDGAGTSFLVARRLVHLDQTVVLGNNLAVFF